MRRIRRFYDWRSVAILGRKLEDVVEAIEQLAAPVKTQLEFLFLFFETDDVIMNTCDDSTGRVGMVYRGDAMALFRRIGPQCEDSDWLGGRVLTLAADNDYGARDELLPAACEFLPEATIRELIDEALVREKGEDLPKYCLGHGWLAQLLAAGIPDGPLHEQLLLKLRKGQKPNAAGWNDIAKVYLNAGDAETALDRLSRIPEQENFQREETEGLKLRAYQILGDSPAVIASLSGSFLAHPSETNFSALLEALPDPDKERSAILEKLAATYHDQTSLDLVYLDFALDHLETAELQRYLLQRAEFLDGFNYPLLNDIAEKFIERHHTLCATLILRSMADEILGRAKSKYYNHAVKYLKTCDRLAPTVEDWQAFPDHAAYCASLQEQHARKTALWSKWKVKA